MSVAIGILYSSVKLLSSWTVQSRYTPLKVNKNSKICLEWHLSLTTVYRRVSTQTGKMGRHFSVREKSENFEQTGKVREFQTNVIFYF